MKKIKYLVNNEEVIINLIEKSSSKIKFSINDKIYDYSINLIGDKVYLTDTDGSIVRGKSGQWFSEIFFAHSAEHFVTLEKATGGNIKGGAQGTGSMESPMPGKILAVKVKAGDRVSKGDVLVVMEAMKMEHSIKASQDGIIEKIFCNEGDQVPGHVELVQLVGDDE